MADVADVHPCRFRWDIFNPFLPYRRMVATFYHGSPTLTQWKVTLDPRHRERSLDNWPYNFSLKWDNYGEGDYVTEADEVAVKISVKGESAKEWEEIGYTFHQGNSYKYEFETSMRSCEPHLAIEVEISFPMQNIADQEGLQTDYYDLKRLSEDLKELLDRRLYYNLWLESADESSNFPVHSYILQERWNNFFRVHTVDRTISNQTVGTDVSTDLLQTILTYVYSGAVDVEAEDLKNPLYATLLFKEIDRYHLHHLYKAFARDESVQVRTTQSNLCSHTQLFKVNHDDGRPFEELKCSWQDTPETDVSVNCRLRFFFSPENPHFLFILEFTSAMSLHVRVIFEYRRSGARIRLRRKMFERDYTIRSNATVDSGTCHFRRNIGTFNRFLAGEDRRERGRPVEHYVTFILYISDGRQSIHIQSEDNIGLQGGQGDRLELLSDHMYDLLTRRAQADLRVVCRSENPDNPPEIHLLHKAIFAARVPGWRAVIENVPDDDVPDEDIPDEEVISDEVTCILGSEAFRLVIDYIYTGKVPPIPNRYHHEIINFAKLGRLTFLEEIVYAMAYSLDLDARYPRLLSSMHTV